MSHFNTPISWNLWEPYTICLEYNIKNVIGKLKEKNTCKLYKYKNKKHHFLHLLFFCRGFFYLHKNYKLCRLPSQWTFPPSLVSIGQWNNFREDDQNNMRSYTDNAEEGSKLMTICISHNPLGQDRWVKDKLVVHATSKSLLRLICYKKKKKMKFYQRPIYHIFRTFLQSLKSTSTLQLKWLLRWLISDLWQTRKSP